MRADIAVFVLNLSDIIFLQTAPHRHDLNEAAHCDLKRTFADTTFDQFKARATRIVRLHLLRLGQDRRRINTDASDAKAKQMQ